MSRDEEWTSSRISAWLDTIRKSQKPSTRYLRLFLFALVLIPGFYRFGFAWLTLQESYIYRKDFLQDYCLVRAIQAGIDPYRPLSELVDRLIGDIPFTVFQHPTPHPPTLALILYPLGLVSYPLAVQLWFWCGIILTLVVAALLVRWVSGRFILPYIGLLFVILIGWYPFMLDLAFGQSGILLLLILLGAWLFLRNDRHILGGCLLGVVIALKLYAFPIGLMLVIKKKWLAVLATALSVLLLNLAAVGLAGFESLWRYYTEIGPSVQAYYRAYSLNFSLASIGWKLFSGTGSPSIVSYSAPPLIRAEWLAPWVGSLIPLLFLLLGLFLILRMHNFDLAFSLAVVLSILVSPVAWQHYLVLLVIPFTVYLKWLSSHRFPDRASFAFVGLLAFLYPMTIRNLNWLVAVASGSSLQALDTATVSFAAGALTLLPAVVLLFLFVMLDRAVPAEPSSKAISL